MKREKDFTFNVLYWIDSLVVVIDMEGRIVAINKVVNMNRIITDFQKTPEFDKLKSVHGQVDFQFRLAPELLNIAVAYMKNNSADLIIRDMIMEPGMDGLETYQQILTRRPGQKTIVVSGFSETERVKETLRRKT